MAASHSARRSTRLTHITQPREDSWEQVASQAGSNDALRSPTSFATASFGVASLLDLPRSMSNRAGVQLERFAEILDQTKDELDEQVAEYGDDEDSVLRARHDAGMWLLTELKEVSTAISSRVEQQYSKEGKDPLSKTWRGRIQGVKDQNRSSRRFDSSLLGLTQTDEPSLQDLRKVQAEQNTWDLLQQVLEIRKPKPTGVDIDVSIQLYLDVRGAAHQYTPETELWERFLLSDASAREKKAVLDWLEGCAARGETDVKTIVEHLEASAGTGTGTWSHGFLNTRERIKGEKRRRGLDSYLDSPTLRNSENTEPLVTQLDPDAPSRQGRSLEKPDDYYDRSLWLACFAMLRRGTPWEEVTEWCEERREGWRAVSFGMAVKKQLSKTGLGGPQAGLLWRQMCLAAARHSGFDVYQRAVYGLLAGDIKSVDPACRSFDDLLYARYNALLIRSFEEWLLKAFPDRFTSVLNQKFPALNSTVSEEELDMDSDDYIYKIANHPSCVQEASESMKVLQASIIGDDFQRLITHLGIILAHKANPEGQPRSRLLPPLQGLEYNDRYACLAEDFDAIRMVVHIFAIYEYVGYEFPENFRFEIVEYVIVAYIDYLRLERKLETIPVYAALLSEQRRHITLGVVLVDITDPTEQKELLGLIRQQDVDLARVVVEQYRYAAELMDLMTPGWKPISRFEILEGTDDPRWPGYHIKRDFKPSPVTFEEERLVRSIEWFLQIESGWKETFYGMSFVLRGFLLSGMFNAALAVTKQVPFKAVSLSKSSHYLGRSADVFKDEGEHAEEPNTQLRRSTRASSRQLSEAPRQTRSEEEQFTLDMLRSQSRQYREMQQLTLALEQLAFCKDFEEIIMSKAAVTADIKKALGELLQELTVAVEPLLHGFMTLIDEEQDVDSYTAIRRLYVPSVILAYSSFRTFASTFLGPEHLLPSLELATTLATDENADLALDFAESGLLEPFVKAMASSSKTLLRLNQERELDDARKKSKKKKASAKGRFWVGESVDVWDPTRRN